MIALRSFAHCSEARKVADFDVADPKWWFETASSFRFVGRSRSDISARKVGSSPRAEEGVLVVERLTRISNYLTEAKAGALQGKLMTVVHVDDAAAPAVTGASVASEGVGSLNSMSTPTPAT